MAREKKSAPNIFDPTTAPMPKNSKGTNTNAHKKEDVASTYSPREKTNPFPKAAFFEYAKVIYASSMVMGRKLVNRKIDRIKVANSSTLLLKRELITLTLILKTVTNTDNLTFKVVPRNIRNNELPNGG